MNDLFFISYSRIDGNDFAIRLANILAAGPPAIPVWIDQYSLRPGEDWDEQIDEAIKTCKGMIFIMSLDSVLQNSVCKNEWVRALRYKKPVILLLINSDLIIPFRLESREYIDFTGSFDSAIARLRLYLMWLDTNEGRLQALKIRLVDAQRELPHANRNQQNRITKDIAELEQQIFQLQEFINNPEVISQKIDDRILAGLEKEIKSIPPVVENKPNKVINPPPLIAPTWFQDRNIETRQIVEFINDEALRMMVIVGRSGIGKSAMVCRLLRSLENGQLPDDGGTMNIDGIVYLSATRALHRTSFPDLYESLTKLLPEETVKKLDIVYKNPSIAISTKMEFLVEAFPCGQFIILLDNFEDMISVETGKITDIAMDEVLRSILELPHHGLKIIITTRVLPNDLVMVQPGRQRRLDLDKGLERPYAENILREMDANSKIGLWDAPENLLSQARELTLGIPRALEQMFGILSADRNASLQEILENTRRVLKDKVMSVLVGEAFSRLDLTAQRVMQALSIYRYQVPPTAIDYILQPYVPGIDSGEVLGRLINMQFVHKDRGKYYLHQVDRNYALSRILEGNPEDRNSSNPPFTRFAMLYRAAEWFRMSRKPREAWKTFDDFAAQFSEFDLRCEAEDFNTAAKVLLEFDFDYLFLWGHYQLMIELHERLQGKIPDLILAENSVGNLGSAYYRTGQIQKAINAYNQALSISIQLNHPKSQGVWLGNLAISVSDQGQNRLGIDYLEKALKIRREISDKQGESLDLGNLANRYAEIGQNFKAIEYLLKSLDINRDIMCREGEAENMVNLIGCYKVLGDFETACKYYKDTINLVREIHYPLCESAALNAMGEVYLLQGMRDKALMEFKQAIEIADNIGNPQFSKCARVNHSLVNIYMEKLDEANKTIEAALKYDVPISNLCTLAVQGLVALRQQKLDIARKAFTSSINEANKLITLTPDRYEALDVKAFSLCGLSLCGDVSMTSEAKKVYEIARKVASDVGIIQSVLQIFDALSKADTMGILAEVRPIAGRVITVDN